MSAIAEIDEGDPQAWFDRWMALGERVQKIADESAARGHLLSAAGSYLRASTYFGVALGGIDRLKSDELLVPTFRLHREAWDNFVDGTSIKTERVDIPYEGMTMPGYLFKPTGTDAKRCLILVNGSDGTLSGLWGCAKAALERGYTVLMFDGPGQQSLLFERDVPFRFDWEAVITPVVDFLLERADVGSNPLAIYGVSQAGYWVPRALAFEHRIAAAVADPGVVDVSTSWVEHLPSELKKLLNEGNERRFDIEMSLGMKLSGDTSRMWKFRARPYRQDSYFKTIREVLKYNLTDVAGRIRTPMFITDPEDEQFWPGQAKRLADMLPGEKMLSAFTAAEGANFHCQPLARTLTEQRMFDWLDDVLKR
ncbi:alpha/beta fold hydrolase [Sinorhizobium sp. BG8]|uniref:alpha/beta hydrolase family protein n=1 Tax=Sinorhizobium sp. BG8 TaxID=2613773 RepID=UPI00193E9B70|nr:alpha/beta fold hydrolase [Sinorhizobium sp. BG8]